MKSPIGFIYLHYATPYSSFTLNFLYHFLPKSLDTSMKKRKKKNVDVKRGKSTIYILC